MAVRPVLRYPEPVLKTLALPLEPGPHAEAIAADLVDTMRASPACVGIAAPQIGESVRAFCADVTGHRRARSQHGLIVMINPVIEASEGAEVIREGCMSLPDFTGNVRRAAAVVVRGLTPEGETIRIESDAFEARALQHEIDHLDGLLFLDRVSSLTSDVFTRKRYDTPPSR
ncbi:MAG: peptide deformylase [Actinomycetota bacterium]|nr:peptide deformylase [Actinomycetota bacterium]